ncbi:MAG: hypothetical protein JRG71_04765 [Deltaproteobacteria bacterium]|nr:hypothetical protein [Deltaproteobacteria bacterium]
MGSRFARKTYKHWMKENRSRFIYAPYIIKLPKKYKNRHHYFALRFTGIIDDVVCLIRNQGAEIWATNKALNINDDDYFWDIIMEFELTSKKTYDGLYYCGLCADDDTETPSYYSTRAALWKDHVLEELLQWINNIDTKDWLGFYEHGADLHNEPESEMKIKTKKTTSHVFQWLRLPSNLMLTSQD